MANDGRKQRAWEAVCYPENMRGDWQEEIDGIIQLPYAYAIHDASVTSKGEDRKVHVHILVVWPSPTTGRNALNVFLDLSAPGKKCCSTVQPVINVRHAYDYLIHDTDNARKKGKEQYPPEARICGNNFDIGDYEQVSTADRDRIFREYLEILLSGGYTNFVDFIGAIYDKLDDPGYLDVFRSYSSVFERVTRGNYLKCYQSVPVEIVSSGDVACGYEAQNGGVNDANVELNHEKKPLSQGSYPRNETVKCCPNCGSIDIVKRGKTQAGSQRWLCRDCGKTFTE